MLKKKKNYYALGSCLHSKEHKLTQSSTSFSLALYPSLHSALAHLQFLLNPLISINNLDAFLSSEIPESSPLLTWPSQHMVSKNAEKFHKKISKCLYNQQNYFHIETLPNGSNPEQGTKFNYNINTAHLCYGISLLIWK